MNGEKHNSHISNPHDKLFKETWSDLKNTRSFLQNFLPGEVLKGVFNQ